MRALLIMGPTASGKSALAMEVAERIGGEIINADSMQVYGDLHVLTARPSVADEERAPHHMYGHVDASQRHSVGRWLEQAMRMIAIVVKRGGTPIIVGGTGLYFMALTKGLAEMPAPDAEVRAELEARAAKEGAAALYAELAVLDPDSAARLAPNDAPRILRALEIVLSAGAPIGAFQAATTPALDAHEWAGLAMVREPREPLYAAIDARFEAMLAAGALEEVRALAARGLDPALPAMKAHGAPALMAHLRGELSLAEAAEIGKRDTRRYAKRQHTWIRGQMPDWHVTGETDRAKLTQTALDLIGRA